MIQRRDHPLWQYVGYLLFAAPFVLIFFVALALLGVFRLPGSGRAPTPTATLDPGAAPAVPTQPELTDAPVIISLLNGGVQVPTATLTPSNTPTQTPTSTITATPTQTPTDTPTATLTATLEPTATASVTVTQPAPSRTAAPTPSLTTCTPAIVPGSCEGLVTIRSYGYQLGEVSQGSFPYPTMDFWLVAPPQAAQYRLVVIENDALRLSFLPDLGGRLYQITDKTSGADLLYNNPVIMPTHWGPKEVGWWLQVGGVEWAFPTDEHGYAWHGKWDISTYTSGSGSIVARLTYYEPAEKLDAVVTVTLPPGGRAFDVEMAVENTDTQMHSGQFWINAQQLAGPGAFVDLPVDKVVVHSAGPIEGVKVGNTIRWTSELGTWEHWYDWFSAFGDQVTGSQMTGYPAGNGPGLRRTLDPNAPGVKFFILGIYDRIPAEYDGLPYFELWTGLTPDFSIDQDIYPGEQLSWKETWKVVNR